MLEDNQHEGGIQMSNLRLGIATFLMQLVLAVTSLLTFTWVGGLMVLATLYTGTRLCALPAGPADAGCYAPQAQTIKLGPCDNPCTWNGVKRR